MGFLHVRFDEIALKGANRPVFERKLRKNLRRQLQLVGGNIRRARGRVVIETGQEDPRECLPRVARVFGVASVSPVLLVPREIEKIEEACVAVAREAVARGLRTFKVEARRSDKSFPMKSMELAPRLGGAVLKELAASGLSVKVTKPDFKIGVEVHKKDVAVHALAVAGPGGIPVGTSGRALTLLSGGIDSPVAAWYTLKRGLHTDFVYFHSFPYTGDKAREKVLTLARELSRWAPDPLFCFVPPFAKIQDAIGAAGDEELRTVVLRRCMYRVSARIAALRMHRALVTGEVVGQVASQTPENLRCVEVVVPDLLVLRPLVGFDKNEVVIRAKQIGTFETSILPYEDCCSLFAPRHPATKANPKKCQTVEDRIPNLAALEAESVEKAEVYRLSRGEPPQRVEDGVKPFRWRDGTIPTNPDDVEILESEEALAGDGLRDDEPRDDDEEAEALSTRDEAALDDGADDVFTTDLSES